jgi:Transposase DDE domain
MRWGRRSCLSASLERVWPVPASGSLLPVNTARADNCRRLVVYTRSAHEALRARRLEQNSGSWKKRYACRAGIEGTLSQGVRRFGLHRYRYPG